MKFVRTALKYLVVLVGAYLGSLLVIYLALAAPYASPMEVWETRYNPHSGALVFIFSAMMFLVAGPACCIKVYKRGKKGRKE